MGSRWSSVFFADDRLDETALALALQSAVDAVEDQMSAWRPESDIERFNRSPAGSWQALPRNLLTVLQTSVDIGDMSGGAFDVGVGDLVKTWGLGAGSRTPDLTGIASLASPSGKAPKTLQIDHVQSRARRFGNARIDLSGIAKGFGVDELARAMTEFGVPSWLVGIDGEMRAHGRKPDGHPWAVGHERPDRHSRSLMGVIELDDLAVATSGNYRHFVEVGGKSVSHTFDPRVGAPLENDLASSTVIAPSAMEADAWATALMVLGPSEGAELARRIGVRAILVANDGTVVDTADAETRLEPIHHV
jgi:thiamine biosynthesis lipoprotein